MKKGLLCILLIILVAGCPKKSKPTEKSTSETTEDDKALFDAALSGDIVKVETLLKKGVNVNAKNIGEGTALMAAAFYGHTDIVKLLLENKADVNAKGEYGETALMRAALSSERTDIIKLLLEAGADVNAKSTNGKTALMTAAKNGHTETVNLLKEYGAKD